MDYQAPQPLPGTPSEKTSLNMDPKLEAALCYLCFWLTGLIFFLLEKENNYVRFHAMQSIITFGGLTVLSIGLQVLTIIPVLGWIFWIAAMLLSLGGLVAWIVLMIKAYQGERFHFPIAGDIAEKNIA